MGRIGLSENARGALLMMGSMAAFTVNDTLIKRAGEALPLMQILTIRGAVASLALGLLAWRAGVFRIRVGARDMGLIGLRSAAEVGAAWFFLTALMAMPLANVTALLQTLPLTVTLGAALVFGEPVGWRRWGAIALGFCGMLMIVRPGGADFDEWSLYALVAVVFVTARDLVVRKMSPGVPSLTVTLAASLSVTVFAGALSLGPGWAPVPAAVWPLVLGAGACVSLGYLLSVLVMRAGAVSVVAPFRYTGLIWALLLGWLVFGEWPAPLTLAGAAVIAAAGIVTLLRDRVPAGRGARRGPRGV